MGRQGRDEKELLAIVNETGINILNYGKFSRDRTEIEKWKLEKGVDMQAGVDFCFWLA